jgi:hypothetical protein
MGALSQSRQGEKQRGEKDSFRAHCECLSILRRAFATPLQAGSGPAILAQNNKRAKIGAFPPNLKSREFLMPLPWC